MQVNKDRFTPEVFNRVIEHWLDNLKHCLMFLRGENYEIGYSKIYIYADQCEFCKLCPTVFTDGPCFECPILIFTGHIKCEGTPWVRIYHHMEYLSLDSYTVNLKYILYRLILSEVLFLLKLREKVYGPFDFDDYLAKNFKVTRGGRTIKDFIKLFK